MSAWLVQMAQVKISNSDSTKIIECCWPSNAGIRIANDIKRIIETFIPAGKITGARIYHRPLREFEEASVFFSCCPCSHHWWVEFAVNAPTSDDDPVNYFLVEKSQESIKISVNNVKWVLDEQRKAESPTGKITQKKGVIIPKRDVHNKKVPTSHVTDFIAQKILSDHYFLVGRNCQNFVIGLMRELDFALDWLSKNISAKTRKIFGQNSVW